MTTLDTAVGAARGGSPALTRPTTGIVRRVGASLAVTAPLWALATMLLGDHEGFGWQTLVMGVPALAFQLSILGLLRIQAGDGAMTHPGMLSRLARVGYLIEVVLLCGAMVSTILDAGWLLHGTAFWATMDVCWPLSMLGMLIIGVRVAIAGRWTGALRWQTLFAQSWILWGIPFSLLGSPGLIIVVVQVVLGYGGLGARLALRPDDGR
ncbi:MAG: hypothetical protein QM809_13285 [Gordonia sp. (in: high G+C Gram-positive bacteria)]|uniref:hypothetical protein n=1 Tax=Gordonia sp. (in: high G+C Gram-positive bacteria) TaxID=84139 RepID=UPI0039E647A6